MTTTLVTGATRGLGRETARQLVAAGHTVYVGARDDARGREVGLHVLVNNPTGTFAEDDGELGW